LWRWHQQIGNGIVLPEHLLHRPLHFPGQRIKIFLALLPSAVHLDTPPGSGNFAF
jgi:hypothetical protein